MAEDTKELLLTGAMMMWDNKFATIIQCLQIQNHPEIALIETLEAMTKPPPTDGKIATSFQNKKMHVVFNKLKE
jgi:hypothetical protein